MSLETLYAHQLDDGMLPYAGPPVSYYGRSDTYHLWALIGTVQLFEHAGNATWLGEIWVLPIFFSTMIAVLLSAMSGLGPSTAVMMNPSERP